MGDRKQYRLTHSLPGLTGQRVIISCHQFPLLIGFPVGSPETVNLGKAEGINQHLDHQDAHVLDLRGVASVRRPVLHVDVLLVRRGAEAELGDAEERDAVLRAARLLDLTGLVQQRGRGFLVPQIDLALVIVVVLEQVNAPDAISQ